MSRSGYSDDCENLGLYRHAVDLAIGGKRGQAFLREMAAALDAMPVKELITDEVVRTDGQACAIGAVALARRVDVSGLNVHDASEVATRFGIARSLAAEIAYMNDEWGPHRETPAERWTRMREWVANHLTPPAPFPLASVRL
jgi:hypothetical protein